MVNNLAIARIVYGSDGKGAIARVNEEGVIHAISKKVYLSAEEGQWYYMSTKNAETDKYEQKKVITAKGYDYLRSLIGIYFTSPDTIVNSDGRVVGNPYLHESKGMLEYVKVRIIGACRGPSGNWQAQDLTFVFNFKAYLASDLFAKWHDKRSGTTKDWGRLINSLAAAPCPPDKIRVPVSMGVELEVDLAHPAVMSIYREHLEKQKFAERNAYSMASRNIMRKLLGVHYVDEDNTVTVTVWPQADKDLLKVGSMVERNKQGSVVIDADVIEVIRDQVEATDEDIQSADERDDDQPVVEEVFVAPTPVQRTKVQALAELREMINAIPEHPEKPDTKKNLIRAALKLEGFKTPSDLTKDHVTIEVVDKVKDHLRVTL